MAKLAIGQRAQRTLRFLLGVRSPRATAALVRHGFSERDLREGADLLRAVVVRKLASPSQSDQPGLLARLDAFEAKWMPVVRHTLGRHYPEIAEQLLANIAPSDGITVAITAGAFISRLHGLDDTNGPYGSNAKAARELLATRGLTHEVVEAAAADLAQLQVFAPEEIGNAQAATREAEDAMWSWYLEWSGIARATIKDRNVLRSLGFLRQHRGGTSEVDDTTDANSGSAQPALPALSTTPHPPQLPSDTLSASPGPSEETEAA